MTMPEFVAHLEARRYRIEERSDGSRWAVCGVCGKDFRITHKKVPITLPFSEHFEMHVLCGQAQF